MKETVLLWIICAGGCLLTIEPLVKGWIRLKEESLSAVVLGVVMGWVAFCMWLQLLLQGGVP